MSKLEYMAVMTIAVNDENYMRQARANRAAARVISQREVTACDALRW